MTQACLRTAKKAATRGLPSKGRAFVARLRAPPSAGGVPLQMQRFEPAALDERVEREEVRLWCSVLGDGKAGITHGFQPRRASRERDVVARERLVRVLQGHLAVAQPDGDLARASPSSAYTLRCLTRA
jgi:hypothetical protein